MADGTGDIETSADLLQAEIRARAVCAQERADDVERCKTTLAREGLSLTGDALLILMAKKARFSAMASRLRMLDARMDLDARADVWTQDGEDWTDDGSGGRERPDPITRSHPEWISITRSPGFRALDGAVAKFLEEAARAAVEESELDGFFDSIGGAR